MKKNRKIIGRLLIVAILAIAVFTSNNLKVNASSYSYDFWKNVIPSAEGLAHSDTYYSTDIKDQDGNEVVNFSNELADLATYQEQVYVLDSKNQTTTEYEGLYSTFNIPSMSVVYILDKDLKFVEAIDEFVITDEIKEKLNDYYDFELKDIQITSNHFASTELVNFGTTTEYKYTVSAGNKEIAIPKTIENVTENGVTKTIVTHDFVYATYQYSATNPTFTYSNDYLKVYVNGEKIDKDLWEWTATGTSEEDLQYYLVLDDSVVKEEDYTVVVEYFDVSQAGKAPYVWSKERNAYVVKLNGAQGITVADSGMYIADTGNSRILRCQKVEGQWVVDGIYLTPDDNVFYQVSSGKTQATTTDATLFKPVKVAVDQRNMLYCIAENVYEGIIEFHESGSFNRFFGKNTVVANPLKQFWTKIFSETQIESLEDDLPPQFTNIATDADGFLYATSNPDADDPTSANMVKMINTSGKDVMKRNGYVTPDGDAVYITTSSEQGVIAGASHLTGVTISKNQNFTVVDSRRGRLFTYDNEGNLLYITGDQPGGTEQQSSGGLSNSIINPVAISYFTKINEGQEEENLLVLDKASKSIMVFKTTEFGKLVNTATGLYQNGIVEDIYLTDEEGNVVYENGEPVLLQAGAETYWREAVKINTNYELAYLGIGKALHRRGEYKEAMEYFELAHNATYYSKAYAEYRDQILSKNFSWIMTAVILLIVLWVVLKYQKFLKKKNAAVAASIAMNEEKANIISGNISALNTTNNNLEQENDGELEEEAEEEKKIDFQKIKAAVKNFFKETVSHPLYIMSHPIQGYTEFKTDKKGKMWVAIVILMAYVLMEIIAYQYEGIVTNTNNPQKFNSILILIYGVVPPFILSVANWSVTTLLDGKGKMKEIFMMVCYSLFPVTMIGFLNIILSNVLTLDEAQFIMLLSIVGWVLTGYMVFMGLVVIHEYGVGKTLWSIILTILATLIIAFIALLIFDLAQQIYGFLYELYTEITVRYF